MKWVTVVLSIAIVYFQYSLWFGKGSVGHTKELQEQLILQTEKNQTLVLRNNFLAAEVNDLANGQEAISEIARVELGYVQEGETYYRFVEHKR
ncbi:cell division protein FtsB [Neisseria animalis]|uniref:Cell division protein FtsB n=1 Tax=Neisseria animalis TaxID=492 RepID=A0A5P3MT02_NEIAN|nr:cell division protein FtsB [Neisseria animalis]QEY24737.1 cell division protein FtsB [Neisseria animalis]ROW31860.1 cell division protein FtsB [Neisseria animalis]VEE07821.1 Cell division protein ftsB-like protein [Neisseria animalis]